MDQDTWLMEDTPAFADRNLPAFYADGIANLSTSPATVKFYLVRLDPSLNSAHSRPVPVAQVIMPTDDFISMTAFFEIGIERLISKGQFTREQVEAAKRELSDDVAT